MLLISQIGSGISLIGCVMTLSILCFLDIKGDGLFIAGNMSVVMMGAQLSFLGAENTYPKPIMCKIAAFILLYFFLALHCSSICHGLHLWSKLNALCFPCKKRPMYVLLTWVTPIFVVFITAVVRSDTFAENNLCWLPATNHTRLAFLLPVTCILLTNSALFCRVIWARFKHDYSKGRKMSLILKNAALTTISLFPVLNLPWLFGYSMTFDLHNSLQYIYVLLCSGQGMLVLIMHVLTNGQVKKAIFARLAEVESDLSSSTTACGRAQRTVESDADDITDNITSRSRVKVEPKKDS